MRSRMVLILALLGLVLVGAPSAAQAQNCEAPPGTAATEQYCELFPTASGGGGGGVGGESGSGGGSTLEDVLPADVVERLRRLAGGAGESLLRVPATQPSGDPGGENGDTFAPDIGELGEDPLSPPPGEQRGLASDVGAVTGGRVGAALLWLLGATVVGVVGASLLTLVAARRGL